MTNGAGATVSAVLQAFGAGSYGLIGGVIAAVDMGEFQRGTLGPIFRAEAQNDPCTQANLMRELQRVVFNPGYQAVIAQISGSLEWTAGAIDYSLRNKGKDPARQVVGSTRLAAYALDRLGFNILPHDTRAYFRFRYGPQHPPNPNWVILPAAPTRPGVPRFPAFPPGILATYNWIDAHMPSGESLEDGSWRDQIMEFNVRLPNFMVPLFVAEDWCAPGYGSECWARDREVLDQGGGMFLVPGDRVWPFNRNRPGAKYRGSRIRAVIEEWIQLQEENVADKNYRTPRRLLTDMVGTWRGTGPRGLWSFDDPQLPGSSLRALDAMMAEWAAVYQVALQRCAEDRQTTAAQVEEELATEESLRKRKEQREDTFQIAVMGGLALAAIGLARR